jgi:hypothetical protein
MRRAVWCVLVVLASATSSWAQTVIQGIARDVASVPLPMRWAAIASRTFRVSDVDPHAADPAGDRRRQV